MSVLRKLLLCFALASFAVPATAQAADGALQAVSLSAVVAAGGKPLNDVHFTVTSIGSTAPVQATASSDQGKAQVQVPAGRYKVVASYGHSQSEKEITVGDGASSHELTLNAGTVNLKLLKHVGGKTIRTGLDWEILTYGKDASGNRHLITSSKAAQPKFVLPEGWYLARVVNGTQTVKHTIEVTTGATYNYTLILQ